MVTVTLRNGTVLQGYRFELLTDNRIMLFVYDESFGAGNVQLIPLYFREIANIISEPN